MNNKDNKQGKGDCLIRHGLIKEIQGKYTNCDILEEVRFPLVKADVLVIDHQPQEDFLIYFEIKSGADDLRRLPQQLRGAMKYCNRVFVVADKLHAQAIFNLLGIEYDDFWQVGVLFFNPDGTLNEVYKPASLIRPIGISTGFIKGKKHQLYPYIPVLKGIWGEL